MANVVNYAKAVIFLDALPELTWETNRQIAKSHARKGSGINSLKHSDMLEKSAPYLVLLDFAKADRHPIGEHQNGTLSFKEERSALIVCS